jgi:hypothetical protein
MVPDPSFLRGSLNAYAGRNHMIPPGHLSRKMWFMGQCSHWVNRRHPSLGWWTRGAPQNIIVSRHFGRSVLSGKSKGREARRGFAVPVRPLARRRVRFRPGDRALMSNHHWFKVTGRHFRNLENHPALPYRPMRHIPDTPVISIGPPGFLKER